MKHLNWNFLQKRLIVYSRRQFSQKALPLTFERVLNNTNIYFDESYSAQLLKPPLNLQIWCKIPAPSLITPSPHPTINLQRIKIFKTGFRKLSILSKLWEWYKWERGGRLVCVIMTHCVRKSICDSALNEIFPAKYFHYGFSR